MADPARDPQQALPPWPFDELPGGEWVRQGLLDVRDGVESIPGLLVRIGGPRLRQLGADIPRLAAGDELPEHRLYLRLAGEHGDAAHGRYNALIRRLVSFERAAELAMSTRERQETAAAPSDASSRRLRSSPQR